MAARQITKKKAAEIYAVLSEVNPQPDTELNYKDPFTLLVAVVLSAQATDEGVNRATKTLFPVANTPQQIAALGEEKLGAYIKTIGLWRNKAKNVIALSNQLLDEHGGEVPRDRDALEALPGVGRKTANVVMNVAFGAPTIAVDTHIFRVSNRTGLGPGKNPLEVELALEKITPPEFLHGAHHWLILHGRYVCKARKPECWRCAIAELCRFKEKTPDPLAQKDAPKKTAMKRPAKKLAGAPKLRSANATRKTKKPKRKTSA